MFFYKRGTQQLEQPFAVRSLSFSDEAPRVSHLLPILAEQPVSSNGPDDADASFMTCLARRSD